MTIYGTLADSKTYHSDRGNDAWTGTDEALNEALLRGSEYVDYHFRSSFPGYPTELRDQDREWPRAWAFDIYDVSIPSDEVPIEVKRATYEAALRELTDPGSLLPDVTEGTLASQEKVGPISITYANRRDAGSQIPVLNIVRGILAPVLTGNSGSAVSGEAFRG